MLCKCSKCMRDFWGRFYFFFYFSFLHFGGVFKNTIIPLSLVGY